MEKVLAWIYVAWTWIENYMLVLLDKFDQWRLFTPMQATATIFIVTTILMMPVVHLWLKNCDVGRRGIVMASLSMPFLLIILLQIPSGFAGIPDDNCGKYNGGKMTFTLLNHLTTAKESDGIYGEGWLVLIVRASERWGSESHQCRLSLSDPKAKVILQFLKAAEEDSEGGGRWSRAVFTFSFGGRNEVPNVKIKGRDPDPKMNPPEVPEAKKHKI